MTEPIEIVTEAGTIAELAEAACAPEYIHPDGGGLVAYGAWPRDWEIRWHDFEDVEQRPRRKRGTVKVADTDGLLNYIDLQITLDDEGGIDPLPTIYHQPREFRAVAVFNDHTEGGPGWRDHRAELQLRTTDEWRAWTNIDRSFSDASTFAEFVEEWRHTIADPTTADLLDLVRSFRATTKVTFRQELVDKSGDRALEYVTETEAQAGAKGTLPIPDEFTLALAPFDGAEPRLVRARFRYRLDGGRALFGVVLEQPALVAKAAFEAELDRIREHAPFVLINGQP